MTITNDRSWGARTCRLTTARMMTDSIARGPRRCDPGSGRQVEIRTCGIMTARWAEMLGKVRLYVARSAVVSTVVLATLAATVALAPVGEAKAEGGPAITGVSPSCGPTQGGTTVLITGTGLEEPTAVMFGEEPALSFSYSSEMGAVAAVSPAHTPGTVAIRITTAEGATEVGQSCEFTFLAVPTVTGVTPTSGTTGGGTPVIISGTGLDRVTAVFFGDSPAAEFLYDPGTGTITAMTPAHAAGQVQIMVKSEGGTSADTPADDFTFVQPLPTIWYEQTDSRIRYTGAWYTFSTASASGGSYRRANSNSAYVTFFFVGERLDWITMKGTTTGVADVSVDGVRVATVDLSNPVAVYKQKVWSTEKLPHGLHRVCISRNPASPPGKYITVDAVAVVGTLVSPSRVEQTDGRLHYSGIWSVGTSSSYSGSSHRYASSSGASLTAEFEGDYFAWIATKGANYGIAKVTLDNAVTFWVDLYSPLTLYRQKVWETPPGLASGPHKVKIECTGTKRAASSGTRISVDAFEYLGTVTRALVPNRFEENDARIAYLGSWSGVSAGSASGGAYKRAGAADAGVSVVFSGTRLEWLATTGPLMGKADVSVDGGPPVTVDLNRSSTQYKQRVFSTDTLPNGVHRVEITWHEFNTGGAYVTVDAFDILGTLPYTVSLTSDEIRWAEQRLAALSYCPGPIDGIYDSRTRGAIIAFQKWEGLSRDGVLGSVVWARLQVASRPTPRSSGTTAWIEVDKTKQVLLYCKDNTVVRTLPVSTGTTADGGIVTPSGTFKVTRKTVETSPRYLPLYISNYPYSLLAIHGYPNVPTYPASHGCVRTHLWDQDEIYPLIPVGTRVYIYN